MSKFLETAHSLFYAALVAAMGCGGDWSSPMVCSYLAAVVIYGGLTGAPTTGLPAQLRLRSGRTVEVPARDAATAQAAADQALHAS